MVSLNSAGIIGQILTVIFSFYYPKILPIDGIHSMYPFLFIKPKLILYSKVTFPVFSIQNSLTYQSQNLISVNSITFSLASLVVTLYVIKEESPFKMTSYFGPPST